MIITISGTPGAGDTTTTEKLAQELGYKTIKIGEMQKELAKKKGLDSEELWEEQEKNPEKLREFHRKLDKKQREIVKGNNDLIVNGKLSAFQIKEADLKIFLDADIEERAKRSVMRDKIGRREFAEKIDEGQKYAEPTEKEIEKEIEEIRKRENKETKHWKKMYGFDYINDKETYDILIDTTNKKPREVVKIIKKHMETIQDD